MRPTHQHPATIALPGDPDETIALSISAARARGARDALEQMLKESRDKCRSLAADKTRLIARQYAIYELVESEAGKFARLPDVRFSVEAVQCANIDDAEPDCDGFKQATSDLCPACAGGAR